MIELKNSEIEDVDAFVAMEHAEDTSEFVIPYSRDKHIAEMTKDDVIYLSIYERGKLSGFIIVAIDEPGSAEFRRIVVAAKGKGLGQKAIRSMERYCAKELGCSRIWLDVFASNTRGIHIYKKLGYKQFKTGEHNGNTLLFMEKML